MCGIHSIAVWDGDVDGISGWSYILYVRLDGNEVIGGSAIQHAIMCGYVVCLYYVVIVVVV